MLSRYLALIATSVLLFTSSVCAETFVEWYRRTYQRETNFGSSFESARSGQILNPEAGKNLAPVDGLDGEAAEMTMGKYRKGFGGPGEAPVYPLRIQTPIRLDTR